MTVSTYHPNAATSQSASQSASQPHDCQNHAHSHPHSHADSQDDGIRIMPTSSDLTKPHSDKEFIEKAMAEEISQHEQLIASSREALPRIVVNGVALDPNAIASEVQYHPADNQDDALYAAAQALVVRELLKQATIAEPTLGQAAWDDDEEQAIASLISQQVSVSPPDKATCQRYYQQNPTQFVSHPLMSLRHILLACPPEEGDERLKLKKHAYELIKQIQNSDNPDAEFIQLVQQYSACPSKDDAGELGVVAHQQSVPEFETAVFGLDKGLAPSPIESRYGIHIVEVMSKQDGVALDFEQAHEMIANQLGQQAFHHALCDFLYELVDKAQIEGIVMQMQQENVHRG